MEMLELTPDMLLRAYAIGVFPMAEDRDDPELFWVDPRLRGVIPLDRFHVPRRLRRTQQGARFGMGRDEFKCVLGLCLRFVEAILAEHVGTTEADTDSGLLGHAPILLGFLLL